MAIIPTTQHPFNSPSRSHLFLWLDVGTTRFHCIVYWIWVGVWVDWHTKMQTSDGECCNCRKPTTKGYCFSLLWLEANVFTSNTFSFDKLVPMFTSHVLSSIGQSFFLFSFSFFFPLIIIFLNVFKILMFIYLFSTHTTFDVVKANHNSYFTLLVEQKSFKPLYVDARMPCLPFMALALHIVLVFTHIAQYILVESGGNLAICHHGKNNLICFFICIFHWVVVGELEQFYGLMENTIALSTNHGETWVPIFIYLTTFKLVCALSTTNPLKFTIGTPSFAMIIFKCFHTNIWVASSSGSISQHAIVNTLQYFILWTWHAIVV